MFFFFLNILCSGATRIFRPMDILLLCRKKNDGQNYELGHFTYCFFSLCFHIYVIGFILFSCIRHSLYMYVRMCSCFSSVWSILVYLYVTSIFPIKPNSCSPKLTVKVQEAIFFLILHRKNKQRVHVWFRQKKKIQLPSNSKINKQFWKSKFQWAKVY